MCVMCGFELETINHIFFTCKVTSKVWYVEHASFDVSNP